ncbi:glycosyltransferase [Micromonospora sp. HUAS LYJ1]|uniref:glycosyltransferase n=1 Tax=Micromonospora sp. HUAS LYJ1 TaxID=3061626 RepID=UPI00267243F1|nr:glycosyltransferase [Micromonospora sp. HUAS LYJ1]WKU03369.1 glycosyltransferase [Micromonospora sp. HUAS LYJ1]
MILLLAAFGSRGDVDPFVALGCALVNAGHQVRLSTQREFCDLGRDAGLDMRPIDMDSSRHLLDLPAARAALRRNYDPVAIARLMSAMTPQFERIYRGMLSAARGAEAILCHPMVFPALDVAGCLGIPVVEVHHVPAVRTRVFPSAAGHRIGHTLGPLGNRLSYAADEWVAWRLTGRIMNRLGTRILDRPPLSTRQALNLRHRRVGVIVGVSPKVLPRPDDWPAEVIMTGYLQGPVRTRVTLDHGTSSFLAAGPPPILVTLGSTPALEPHRVSQLLVAAARRAGLRIVLQRGVAGLTHNFDPRWVHLVEDLDYHEILGRVVAVVHHGGAGTLAQVLAHGKPSVVLPSFADQFFWAHRVPALGVGPRPLPLKRLTESGLAQRLVEVTTNPEYDSRAKIIAAGMDAEDGPNTAATAVNDLLT